MLRGHRIRVYLGLWLFAFTACTGGGAEQGNDPTPTPESPSPTATVPLEQVELPPIESLEEAGAVAIEATRSADWVLVAFGRAWVSDFEEGIFSFDAKSGKQLDTVPLTETCAAMDQGFGAVWTATCDPQGIARIDPDKAEVTGQVKLAVPAGGEYSIGVGEGAVWAISDGDDCRECIVARIDPETMEITDRFTVPEGATAVRAGLGGVWVTSNVDDQVLHLDPATGEILATIPVAAGPRFFDVGGGGVWVMAQRDGALCDIDAATDELVACTVIDPSGIQGGDLTFGEGFVWLRATDELVAQIDPASGEVVRRIGEGEGSGSAAAGSGQLWISAHDIATLYRVPL